MSVQLRREIRREEATEQRRLQRALVAEQRRLQRRQERIAPHCICPKVCDAERHFTEWDRHHFHRNTVYLINNGRISVTKKSATEILGTQEYHKQEVRPCYSDRTYTMIYMRYMSIEDDNELANKLVSGCHFRFFIRICGPVVLIKQ